MKAKTKIMIAAITFLGVIGTLVFTSIGTTGTFYMTVDELMVNKAKAAGKPVKVSGKIVGETVKWDADNIVLTFEMEGENGERVKVVYEGPKPDALNDEWEAIVEGELTEDNKIVASELLVKCPSKYEALEENGEELPQDHEPINNEKEEGY
jgi:cytochrome c-type biogenesis protein CcmE